MFLRLVNKNIGSLAAIMIGKTCFIDSFCLLNFSLYLDLCYYSFYMLFVCRWRKGQLRTLDNNISPLKYNRVFKEEGSGQTRACLTESRPPAFSHVLVCVEVLGSTSTGGYKGELHIYLHHYAVVAFE